MRAVSGLELTGLAATAAMESMSGSVVDGEANAAEVRLAVTVEQGTVCTGSRGSRGNRPSNAASSLGVAFPPVALRRRAAPFLSGPAAVAMLPVPTAPHSTNAANA